MQSVNNNNNNNVKDVLVLNLENNEIQNNINKDNNKKDNDIISNLMLHAEKTNFTTMNEDVSKQLH
jgi:hypothetical protein